ncbi:hypothetical protein [Paracoccus homiensis]|uniref:hypothetical protein n=1 Tax=Paracoccus homiensis TaxID=364199 RepID=UPI00398D46CA
MADSDLRASAWVEGEYAVLRIPLRDLHGYRVALEPCPCRATKSTATSRLRENLATALKLLSSRGV